MPLHLSLRPGERALIGAAVVEADGPARLRISGDVPVLRASEALRAEDADTPATRLLAAAQAAVFDDSPERREATARLAEDFADATILEAIRAVALSAAAAARGGDWQALLRQTRLLLRHEAAVLPR
jgi:flagellar biosynthesis regulator FlbT